MPCLVEWVVMTLGAAAVGPLAAGDLGFDPLNLKASDPEIYAKVQLRELKNGRLAMVGVTEEDIAREERFMKWPGTVGCGGVSCGCLALQIAFAGMAAQEQFSGYGVIEGWVKGEINPFGDGRGVSGLDNRAL